MIVLIGFAFLAGIVTILSPCILPILPIILSSSVDSSGKRRPFGVVVGFVASFTFFTLFLSTIVHLSGVPANVLRLLSIVTLAVFGLSLVIPQVQLWVERLFSNLTRFAPNGQKQKGFWGGWVIGLSLGLLWTPCVGPILASVISLALSGTVTAEAVVITFAYALGTAIPMFVIMQTGSTVLQKVPWLVRNTPNIQKAFGVLMIITAIGIFFNIDRTVQTFVLNTFPQYGVGLTAIEENQTVQQNLKKINQVPVDEKLIGRPMSELTEPKGMPAPQIIAGGEWFNSQPLKLADLKGKVVLIDFWTYSCINCQRTFPYLRTWWQKYRDQGLVIIGVHAPEFEFEKNKDNLAKAIHDFQLTYPIIQDNNFATWKAYKNLYWPAKYFIDKDGFIRYTHFGEGGYDDSERVIQQLLAEAGATSSAQPIHNPVYQTYDSTPETYLGYSRMENFGSVEMVKKDTKASYSLSPQLQNNFFALQGEWAVMPEYVVPAQGAKLYLNFESKEVFLVARPKNSQSTKIKVYLDDKQQYFGADNTNGEVTVNSDKLYKLINLPSPGQHLLRLEFEDDNVELYAFTFG